MAELEKQKSAIGNAELAQRFVQFVMMQAQNIFYVLGRIPSPDGRPIPPNLEVRFHKQSLIDQLEMIQEKTRGNLSTQETSIIEDALKNVRLAFVEVSGGTPASMMPKSNLPDFPLEEEENPFAEPAPSASGKMPQSEQQPHLPLSRSRNRKTKRSSRRLTVKGLALKFRHPELVEGSAPGRQSQLSRS